jgi:DNA-binding response OmpR family regulator
LDQSILGCKLTSGGTGVSTNIESTQSPTVLICDDEAHIRHIVAAKLRESGLTVLEARDGVQGLELAIAHRPVLVITDLQMPGGSGFDLARALKVHEHTLHTPVLMLTARGYILDRDQLATTNIMEVIAKPFGVRQLMERVRHVLNGATPGSVAA